MNVKEPFLRYLLSVLLVLAVSVISLTLKPIIGEFVPIMIYFLPVLASSWLGGIRLGVLATLVSSIAILYIYSAPLSLVPFIPLPLIYQLVIFLVEGIAVSILIGKLKKQETILDFQRKEKEHLKQIENLGEKLTQANLEIKARDEFLSIASHELKTPLTSMLLQLQSALHNIKNVSLANFSVDNLLKMLESVQQQTDRLSKMINDLLNVSLITTGRLDLDIEEFDLSELTKQVTERFSEKLKREGYNLHMEINKSVVGKWDKLRIEQAISNLISNAIKYGNGKPIGVRVTNGGDWGRVLISDQGIGIPEQHREKIFSLFERAVPSSEYKGLGVGLYITNQIVKAHKGKISVESKQNHGSTFIIELPLTPKI